MAEIWEYVLREWHVIREAPTAFFGLLIFAIGIAVVVIWFAMGWRYKAQLENKDAEIALLRTSNEQKDDIIQEIRRQLNGAAPEDIPDEIKKLKDDVSMAMSWLRLSNELFELTKDYANSTAEYISRRSRASTPEEQSQIWDEMIVTNLSRTENMMERYNERFRGRVAAAMEEMKQRQMLGDTYMRDANAVNPLGIEEIATQLGKAGRLLAKQHNVDLDAP